MDISTLEQASYLAEIIGVVAVVGSIVYLAIQVKQSTQATRSETSNVVTSNAVSQYHLFSTDGELFAIIQRGAHDPDSLTNIDQGRFFSYIFTFFLNWQNFYSHWQKNELDTEGWAPWESLMSDAFGLPGIKSVWATRQQYFQKDFRQYVDGLMSKPVNPDFKFMGIGDA